jgi:hypothetical protein
MYSTLQLKTINLDTQKMAGTFRPSGETASSLNIKIEKTQQPIFFTTVHPDPQDRLQNLSLGRGSGGSSPPPSFYSGGELKIRRGKKEK